MKKIITFLIIALIAYILGSSSIFILDETQQAIITQFGKPVGDPRTEAGINFKTPFVQKVQYFDKRYLEWDGDANQVTTKDKKYIFVDSYARWEITEPLQFFRRLKDERSAQSRIDDIIDGETRNAVASNELLDIVRSTNREPDVEETFMEEFEELEDIRIGRQEIEKVILEKANDRCADLGIRILDFKFKRLNYVEEVRNRVFDRMISERNRIADRFRSEGQGEARKIEGDKERDLAKISSEARREAAEIRGRADAEATNIYAEAYNRNNQTRDLYDFLRSMEALTNSFDKETQIILSTDSELYRYLKRKNN